MTAKIYRFPRDPAYPHTPEITFIGSLLMLAVFAVLASYAAPWS
jgi:hypothetical protein